MNNIRRRPKWMRNSAMFAKYYTIALDFRDEAIKSEDKDEIWRLCQKSAKYLNKAARWYGFRSYDDMIAYFNARNQLSILMSNKQEL